MVPLDRGYAKAVMNLDDPMQIADRDPSGVVYSISTLPDACAEASAIGTVVGS